MTHDRVVAHGNTVAHGSSVAHKKARGKSVRDRCRSPLCDFKGSSFSHQAPLPADSSLWLS